MSTGSEYIHNPETIKDDIKIVENLKGTIYSDCSEFYVALDNILRFTKWCVLGTKGKLEKDN